MFSHGMVLPARVPFQQGRPEGKKHQRTCLPRAAYSEQKWRVAYSGEGLSADRVSWTTAGHAVFAWRRLRSRGAEQFGSSIKDFIETEPCIIVAPDYRKAVESPYPAAFNDCYDTLLWIRDNAASIGGRTDRFIVSGHSAGGGLAAAVSLKATDTDDAKIAFQMPLYPMIDDRQNSASVVGNDAPVWDEEANRLAWSRYLDGVTNVTPYAAAARCTDYTKLPPTITYVGSIEPFRDETKIYVESLRRANVPVEFEVFDGAFHAFDVIAPDAPISKRANQFLMENFQKFVQRYFP